MNQGGITLIGIRTGTESSLATKGIRSTFSGMCESAGFLLWFGGLLTLISKAENCSNSPRT